MSTVELFAPPEYWRLSQKERDDLRCGPGRGILEILIPDYLYCGFPFCKAIRITPACSIHDFMYATADASDNSKSEADRVFLNNMVRIVQAAGGPGWLRRWRLYRCKLYFDAVDKYGGPAFWHGKNSDCELGNVAA